MNGFNQKQKCQHCKKEVTSPNILRHEKSCKENSDNVKLCKYCNKTFKRRKSYKAAFCSIKCSQLAKISPRFCIECGKSFYKRMSVRTTCSKECLSKVISKNVNNREIGHSRTPRSRRSYYKEVLMDSSWEYELAEWLDSNNIKWERDRTCSFKYLDENNKERRYYPDFYVPQLNVYLDPKNPYRMQKDKLKLQRVTEKHSIIIFAGSVENITQLLQKIN